MPRFDLEQDAFLIKGYNQARPFSSFLPGIAGPFGKPMWVFYTNRGQCVSSFGVSNKNGAMLEFYAANKAYQLTPLQGFRTFLKIRQGAKTIFYEPFSTTANPKIRQTLKVRAHEIELEEVNSELGLQVQVVFFNAPNEDVPVLVREIKIQNKTKKSMSMDVLDGLPVVVPYGLGEWPIKHMSRTMEAFAQVEHANDHLPYFKLKVEPGDRPEVIWIHAGFFSFTLWNGKSLPIATDPDNVFGEDTSFQVPHEFVRKKRLDLGVQRYETLSPCAFSMSTMTLKPQSAETLHSFYGQVEQWIQAQAFRERVMSSTQWYPRKHEENRRLLDELTHRFALHCSSDVLSAYTRQCYLDNTLRGGQPFVIKTGAGDHAFHFYSRKHGDMERDYNQFEVSASYFSQGNGNFRDVNQNRRSEVLTEPSMTAANVETFFNLIQLDGYNPLVIQFERFYIEKDHLSDIQNLLKSEAQDHLIPWVASPFKPGDLYERLLKTYSRDEAYALFLKTLSRAKKIQDAAHGEGFWIDHWTYNLDLLENYLAVYPDQSRALLVERRDFTYFDNDHAVLPRSRKYVRRADGSVRQLHAVMPDKEKHQLIRHRPMDPHKARTHYGQGSIYHTSLLVKIMGLLAIKAATLDPFGVGLEMESEKPGWCDALNGLPALFGSALNESLELKRWAVAVQTLVASTMQAGETHKFPIEVAELIKAVGEALALAKMDDFYKTWDTLASLKESFREKTRFGVAGEEGTLTREDLQTFLNTLVHVLDAGTAKAFDAKGICATFFMHEVKRYETLPLPQQTDPKAESIQTVKVLEFKQIPLSYFLEGPTKALRVIPSLAEAKKLYKAVKASELYDKKLKMYKLNVPLEKESFEIGRNKTFTPGWLENESAFLHMAYKWQLEILRSGLTEEFFEEMKNSIVAFQKPEVYGRSPLENSSFIASSRFPDARVHGTGFVARLSGATAEWISMVLYMGLGKEPFQWVEGELRFSPQPTLAGWLFSARATDDFEKDTFGFKLFGNTWIVYRNPGRKDTFGRRVLRPVAFTLLYPDGKKIEHTGSYLPDTLARELRDGKLARVTIDLK